MRLGELVAHVVVGLVESQPEQRRFEPILSVLGGVLSLLDGGDMAGGQINILYIRTKMQEERGTIHTHISALFACMYVSMHACMYVCMY